MYHPLATDSLLTLIKRWVIRLVCQLKPDVFGKLCWISLLAGCGGGSDPVKVSTPTNPISEYTIKTEITAGGTISPQGVTLDSGGNIIFTITPAEGFILESVQGCNGILAGTTFSISNLSNNCTVQANFRQQYPTPQALSFTTDKNQAIISWQGIAQAQSYKLYYAEHPFTNSTDLPANYGQLSTTETQAVLPLYKSYNNYFVRIAAVFNSTEIFSQEQLNIRSNFSATGGLNDTAIIYCLSSQMIIATCGSTFNAALDGNKGRDASALQGQLVKIGQGLAGFDFSKIGANGEILPRQNENWLATGNEQSGTRWSCVRDNVTGLIWEIKQPEGIQATHQTFSWYSEQLDVNNGEPGFSGNPNCGLNQCNTTTYIEHLNQQNFCGSSNWRLPNRAELNNIVLNAGTPQRLDPHFFPDVQSDTSYWTNSTYIPASSHAWAVSMNTGIVFWHPKRGGLSVRLVHSQ